MCDAWGGTDGCLGRRFVALWLGWVMGSNVIILSWKIGRYINYGQNIPNAQECAHRSTLDFTLTIDPHRLNTMSIAVSFTHAKPTHRRR